jgi:hypothetical protein
MSLRGGVQLLPFFFFGSGAQAVMALLLALIVDSVVLGVKEQ